MSTDMLALPKVLLMGLRKSGKSSIQKVVFEGMQPHDSTNLPTTVQPDKSTVHSNDFVNFEVWDFPGQNDPFSPDGAYRYNAEKLLENCGAIVFVLDCRELIDDARVRLLDTVCAAYQYSPSVSIEVFIHKVDKLSEDHQSDLLAGLQRRVQEEARQRLELSSAGSLSLNFNLTSIYDHSVFEAFSLVIQKLIKNKQAAVKEALQMCNSNSDVELSYLFFSRSKIFLAVDEHNRDKTRTYELCSDAIEVVGKVSKTYSKKKTAAAAAAGSSSNDYSSGAQSSSAAEAAGAGASSAAGGGAGSPLAGSSTRSASIISLSNDDCLYVCDLPSSLTIVMMMKQSKLENRSLIDYNIHTFYRSVYDIFSANL